MTETAAAIAFNPGRGTPLAGQRRFQGAVRQDPDRRIRQRGQDPRNALRSPADWSLSGDRRCFPGYVDPKHNEGVLTEDRLAGHRRHRLPDHGRAAGPDRPREGPYRPQRTQYRPGGDRRRRQRFPRRANQLGRWHAGRLCGGGANPLRRARRPDETSICRDLREHLERNVKEPPARPKRVVLLDALPVTAVGKIFKPTLRDLAVKEKVRTEIERMFGPEPRQRFLSTKTKS